MNDNYSWGYRDMELFKNTLTVVILAVLLLLSPALQVGSPPDFFLVYCAIMVALAIGGMLIFFS